MELFRQGQFADWEADTQRQLEAMSAWKSSRLMTFDSQNNHVKTHFNEQARRGWLGGMGLRGRQRRGPCQGQDGRESGKGVCETLMITLMPQVVVLLREVRQLQSLALPIKREILAEVRERISGA